jgi:hypothetical protein
MSVVLIVVLVLLAMLASLLGYAATRPDVFRIQRSAVIKAPAWKVFPLIDDLRAFNNWSPYETKDPGPKGTYSGADRGIGAAYAWDARKVGAGRMEITASQAPSSVTMRVDLVRPFKARNTAEFTLRAEADTLTIVTWAMHGPAPYLSKLMGVVFDIEGRIGKDFEAGLANLRALTERH